MVVAEAQVAEALTVLRNQQLVLLEVGNPRVDYRYEMATNRKNQAESSRRAYESQLVSARRTLAFYQNQYEVTQHLFEKKLRTRTQVESWRLKVRDQKEALEKLEHEIEASQLALQGAEAAIERLKSES